MVLTSDTALDRAVSAVELNELALDRRVSPPTDVEVGDEGTCSEEGWSAVVGVEGGMSVSGEGDPCVSNWRMLVAMNTYQVMGADFVMNFY